jgi:hypothetical protein
MAYEVSAILEPLHPEQRLWAINVEYRAPGQYCVRQHSQCLTRDGEWVFECIPSERADEFKAATRFPLQEALRLASAHAPDVVVNGITVQQSIDFHRKASDGRTT